MMKSFLKNIIIFCLAFFFAEKAFYIFLDASPKLMIDNRLEKVITGNLNKDLLVFGSSRGARDIMAGRIEDSLNISSYNLSYPGSDILFHEFLLRSLLKFNKAPKAVLLVVDDPAELHSSSSIKFRFDVLYPLAKYNYINNEMIRRGEKNFLSRFLVLARINKINLNMRKRHFSAMDTLASCGSMPVSFQKKNAVLVYNVVEPEYDSSNEVPDKIDAFKKFQQLCLSNRIKLYIVFPPNFRVHSPEFENRLKELSHPSVSFHVYDTTNTIYRNKDYYYDVAHLKTNGVKIFTTEIISRLASDGLAEESFSPLSKIRPLR